MLTGDVKQADGNVVRVGLVADGDRAKGRLFDLHVVFPPGLIQIPLRHKDERGCLSWYHLASDGYFVVCAQTL